MNPILNLLHKYVYVDRRDWVWPDPYNKSIPYTVPPDVSWKFCENFYGKDFKIQTILFDVKHCVPKSYEFKRIFFEHMHNTSPNYVKMQWLMNDFFINRGLNYPMQVNYHYRQWDYRWLINPGWLRYYLEHMNGETLIPCLYQPIVDSKMEVLAEYYSLEELATRHGITNPQQTFISTTWFYGKPLMQISFNPDYPALDKYQHVEKYEAIYFDKFSKLKDRNVMYVVSAKCRAKIEQEVKQWPIEFQSLVAFELTDNTIGVVTLDDYSDDGFYCGLTLIGTDIQKLNIPKIGIMYVRLDKTNN